MKKQHGLILVLLLAIVLVIQGCSSTAPAPAPTETAAPAATAEPTAVPTATATAVPTAAATSAPAASTTPESAELVLTLSELAMYNGKNGNPAYVAVDGVIYDVTNVSYWKNGDHNGFEAGNDLTEEIMNVSPHGVSKLRGLPVIGKLAE